MSGSSSSESWSVMLPSASNDRSVGSSCGSLGLSDIAGSGCGGCGSGVVSCCNCACLATLRVTRSVCRA